MIILYISQMRFQNIWNKKIEPFLRTCYHGLKNFQNGFENNSNQEPPITAVLNFSMYSLLNAFTKNLLKKPLRICCQSPEETASKTNRNDQSKSDRKSQLLSSRNDHNQQASAEHLLVLLDHFTPQAKTVSMGHICRRSPCH